LPSDKTYLRSSVFEIWKSRFPWLALLMVTSTFTGLILASFENALSAMICLNAFIPMLMGTGGNSGSQSSVTIIRGISVQEIEFSDLFRVLWKELRVALTCGLSLAVVCFAKIMLVDYLLLGSLVAADMPLMVAAVVSVTIALTVVVAKLIGCLLPLLTDKIGLDPAVMASPFITTIVDAVSLLVYFGVAHALLGI